VATSRHGRLTPTKKVPVPTECEAGWDPQLVRKFLEEKKIPASTGIRIPRLSNTCSHFWMCIINKLLAECNTRDNVNFTVLRLDMTTIKKKGFQIQSDMIKRTNRKQWSSTKCNFLKYFRIYYVVQMSVCPETLN
jgi:hypothetical protein